MRISDWSSDVCSSDLAERCQREHQEGHEDGLEKVVARQHRHRQHGNAGKEHERDTVLADREDRLVGRSEEHTSELQSLMRISYAVFCLKKQKVTISQKTCHELLAIQDKP